MNLSGMLNYKNVLDSSLLYIRRWIKNFNYIFSAAKINKHIENGWVNSAYVVSKVGVSALARVHQKMFDLDSRIDIVVNSVHPGYVATHMSSYKGDLTPDQGAEAPVYCALLPENSQIKGKYIWYDKTLVSWSEDELPKNNES